MSSAASLRDLLGAIEALETIRNDDALRFGHGAESDVVDAVRTLAVARDCAVREFVLEAERFIASCSPEAKEKRRASTLEGRRRRVAEVFAAGASWVWEETGKGDAVVPATAQALIAKASTDYARGKVSR